MKMVLALRHERLPRSLHIDAPTSDVVWGDGVRLLRDSSAWPRTPERSRRAGISSFGVSGTNAHLVIEEPPEPDDDSPQDSLENSGPLLFPLSAATPTALRARAKQLGDLVNGESAPRLADIAFSLADTRAHLRHRAVITAGTRQELGDRLAALAAGKDGPGTVRQTPGAGADQRRLVWVFPGQGSQWLGMGMELYDTEPVFRHHLDACAKALSPWVTWDLLAVLRGDTGAPDLTELGVVQPALWAVMISLARLWESYGITPDAVIGHSQGEIAAAHIAGALTLQDSARIVALRSQAAATLQGRGDMASLALGETDTLKLLATHRETCSLAAVNSPTATVISGPRTTLQQLITTCTQRNIPARLLNIGFPSHSPDLDRVQQQILTELATITPQTATYPFHSTVDNHPHHTPLNGQELTATYWWHNIRHTVRFHNTIQNLLTTGHTTYLEISPHPTLQPSLEGIAEQWAGDDKSRAAAVTVTGTLRRGEGVTAMLSAVGRLYTAGYDPDWAALYGTTGGRRIELPTYPFERRRYWNAPARTGDPTALGLGRIDHPLLSAVVELPQDGELLFTGRLDHERHSWAAHHSIDGTAVLPAVAVVELLAEAARFTSLPVVEEVVFEQPLVLPDQYRVQLRVRVLALQRGRRTVQFYARPDEQGEGDGGWVRHASAVFAPEDSRAHERAPLVWPPKGGDPVAVDAIRQRMAELRYTFGPAFLGLRAVWRLGDMVYCEAVLPESVSDGTAGYRLHPALFDAALHGLLASKSGDRDGIVRLPFGWSDVRVTGSARRTVRSRCRQVAADEFEATLYDESGAVVVTGTFTTRPLPLDQLARLSGEGRLYHVGWTVAETTSGQTRERPAVALLGEENTDLDDVLRASERRFDRYPGLPELVAALDRHTPAPDVVCLRRPDREDPDADSVRSTVLTLLETARSWIADDRLSASRLVLVTRGAAAVSPGDDVPDPVQAAVWGLVRSAQLEEPGRFALLDLACDEAVTAETLDSAWAAFADGAEQLAARGGNLLSPRLRQVEPEEALNAPAADAWRLVRGTGGTLEGLALAPAPEALAPLTSGQVRIEVRAAGLNFRDLLIALGSDATGADAALGRDVAGTVVETAPDVTGLAPGDRVAGLAVPALATHVIADHRLVVRIPDELSFPQAASLPAVWATAHYGLVELARLEPGETVLVHAGTGGVGTVAVQIAQRLGATVFATAHRTKWPALRALGLADTHIADSRGLDFEERIRTATRGRGVDVVVNSLTGAFIDASLRLLAPGGRFVEIGVADLRDPADLARLHPDIAYLPFQLLSGDCSVERVSDLLADLAGLWRSGDAPRLPLHCRDIRHAPEAFRYMRDARHVGKLVLTMPRAADPEGTVLVTGGTGTIGRAVTRHLAKRGFRHLLLLSRSGTRAPGVEELRAELTAEGAELTVHSCDTADPDALADALAAIPEAHPLTAVMHLAGVIDDGVLSSLTPQRVADVLRPKTDAALHLHRLTQGLDLAEFVLFSSGAGTLGGSGQAHYAAANAVLDALARHRRARGLPAQSLAWGFWGERSTMTGHLTGTDEARIHSLGVLPFDTEEGLALFDSARALPHPVLAPLRLGLGPLRSRAARGEPVPPLLRDLVRTSPVRDPGNEPTDAPEQFVAQLAALTAAKAADLLLAAVRRHAAAVLGHETAEAIGAELTFGEAGFDSLTALELRNRLARATGLRLPAGLLFDHPTPQRLGDHLLGRLKPREPLAQGPHEPEAPDAAEQVLRAGPAELIALAPPEDDT
ncbi:SDR family NAD(P)-dependent oxidoreductase [Streptomyces sp. NPDC058953]|uniref:SDR family NAD(P)-dependent oxidoreductase n=1 Tax=Streptomyces sp. NPDC058953 TaxID=3346676 RepID=UPI00368C756D